MHTCLRFLLRIYLLVWVPLGSAGELLVTWPSLDMRGAPAVLELAVHGAAAVLSAAAGWMRWIDAPAGSAAASIAGVATGVVSVQSIVWMILPRNVAPGEELPLALIACARSALWLGVLAVTRQDR